LVIVQTPSVHDDIEDLLRQLRSAGVIGVVNP
jgi:hypothetical protein